MMQTKIDADFAHNTNTTYRSWLSEWYDTQDAGPPRPDPGAARPRIAASPEMRLAPPSGAARTCAVCLNCVRLHVCVGAQEVTLLDVAGRERDVLHWLLMYFAPRDTLVGLHLWCAQPHVICLACLSRLHLVPPTLDLDAGLMTACPSVAGPRCTAQMPWRHLLPWALDAPHARRELVVLDAITRPDICELFTLRDGRLVRAGAGDEWTVRLTQARLLGCDDAPPLTVGGTRYCSECGVGGRSRCLANEPVHLPLAERSCAGAGPFHAYLSHPRYDPDLLPSAHGAQGVRACVGDADDRTCPLIRASAVTAAMVMDRVAELLDAEILDQCAVCRAEIVRATNCNEIMHCMFSICSMCGRRSLLGGALVDHFDGASDADDGIERCTQHPHYERFLCESGNDDLCESLDAPCREPAHAAGVAWLLEKRRALHAARLIASVPALHAACAALAPAVWARAQALAHTVRVQ